MVLNKFRSNIFIDRFNLKIVYILTTNKLRLWMFLKLIWINYAAKKKKKLQHVYSRTTNAKKRKNNFKIAPSLEYSTLGI